MAALRNSEATTSTTPATGSVSDEPSAAANTAVDIDPLQPYSSATPIRNVAVAVPPSTRYLRAASALSARNWASSTSAYTGSDISSRPRNSVGRLSEETSRHAPYSEASSST
jgi:hypothetical protein